MKTRSRFVLLLCASLVAVNAAVTAAGGSLRPDDLYRAHNQRKQEGMEASRAAPPSPPGQANASGIEQLPVEKSRPVGLSKRASMPVPPEPGGATSALPLGGPPPCPYAPGMKTASLVKVFPEVSWHVCVRDVGLKGLWVGPVQLRRTPTGPWTWVVFEAGVAEIFVPYHSGTFRPYDMEFCPTAGCALDQVTAQDRGSNGLLVTLTNETKPTVVSEVRDRGVAWLCKQTTSQTRRGEELLVWGVVDGGNYDNIIQYSFRDDGTMTFRMGNTGYNSPPMPTEAHTHNALWRVDMDLNGYPGDSASLLQHNEPDPSALQATDVKSPFNGGVEGMAQWSATSLTSLLIEDAATNAFGNKLGYEFGPAQSQTSRHFGPDDDWTQNDVYVTRYRSSELGWTTSFLPPDDYLLTYLNNESVTNKDLVEWVKTSVHHDPTDEDRSSNDLANPANTTGVTLTHWSGFDVVPHDLFNANPMGGPAKCGP